MSIWYPGSGISFSQYLQADSFVKDIKKQSKSSGKSLESAISKQTEQMVANNQQLSEAFTDGFNSIDGTLNWGFNRLDYVLHNVNASIEALHADFNYNFERLFWETRRQNQLLEDLLSKLDAIHKILESPLLTQAREYYRIGCERMSKGLLDKALEAFHEAEKKNAVNSKNDFKQNETYSTQRSVRIITGAIRMGRNS
ncbi:MAG: hypothetical protein ABR936_05555 [Bacteroidota bacterium]|jgi:hypothetical protein